MMTIASLGEKLKSIYGRWSVFIDPAAKFLLAFGLFLWIRSVLGFSAVFSNLLLILVLALISSVVSVRFLPAAAGLLIIGQAFGISYEAGGVAAALILVLVIMFLRFVPEDAVFAALMPAAMFFGIPVLIPQICGLKRRISSVFAVVSGVAAYYLTGALSRTGGSLKAMEASDYAGKLRLLIGSIFVPELAVSAAAAAGALAAVYVVRRLEFHHAFEAAILAGGVVYPLVILLGDAMTATAFDPVAVVFGSAVSSVISLLLQLLLLPLNFRKSQYLRFEDDDYYYYVKAVPKVTSAVNQEDYTEFPQFDEPLLPRGERSPIDHDELKRRLEDSLGDL